jgi:hypothetical protein
MPVRDPQFWMVSLLALCGLWILLRPFRPRRHAADGPARQCPGCASGSAASAKPRRVALTVEKERI